MAGVCERQDAVPIAEAFLGHAQEAGGGAPMEWCGRGHMQQGRCGVEVNVPGAQAARLFAHEPSYPPLAGGFRGAPGVAIVQSEGNDRERLQARRPMDCGNVRETYSRVSLHRAGIGAAAPRSKEYTWQCSSCEELGLFERRSDGVGDSVRRQR